MVGQGSRKGATVFFLYCLIPFFFFLSPLPLFFSLSLSLALHCPFTCSYTTGFYYSIWHNHYPKIFLIGSPISPLPSPITLFLYHSVFFSFYCTMHIPYLHALLFSLSFSIPRSCNYQDLYHNQTLLQL